MGQKIIILTADDYGCCDFIDKGIITAIKKQKINTVSTFVTHESSEKRINTLLELREKLKTNGDYTFNIGLHFSITSGYSLQHKKSSLTETNVNGKHFFSEAQYYKFRKKKKKDIEQELIAQLKQLDTLLGNIPIDHVSNHHGIVYLDLDFFNVYIKTIDKYCKGTQNKYSKPIAIRSPMSWLKSGLKYLDYDYRFKTPSVQQGIRLGFTKKIFEVTKKKLKRRMNLAKKLNISFPDCLADTIYGQPYVDNLCFLIDQYENHDFSSEFMFHLGDGNKPNDLPHGINQNYFNSREKELEALLEFDLVNYLDKHKINKYNFTQL